MESFKRSFAKAISWRVSGTIFTGIIVFILTGKFSFAFIASGADFVFKIFAYFIHERVWNSISYGRKYRYE